MKPIILLRVTLFSVAFLTAGQPQAASAQVSPRVDRGSDSAGGQSRRKSLRVFHGAIDGRQDLRLELQIDGGRLSGSYFFTQSDPYILDQSLVKGEYTGEGKVTLYGDEVGADGAEKKTKIFAATANPDYA